MLYIVICTKPKKTIDAQFPCYMFRQSRRAIIRESICLLKQRLPFGPEYETQTHNTEVTQD